MRHIVDQIDRYRRIDPQNRVRKAVFLHFFSDKARHAALVELVDPAELIKERKDRRQTVDGDIRLRMDAGLLIACQAGLCSLVLEGRNVGDGRVKVEDLRVRNAAHDLLLARRDRIPRRGGKTNDLFHIVSSRSARAAASFSAASFCSRSTEYGSAACIVSSTSRQSVSFVTSDSSMQCFWPR